MNRMSTAKIIFVSKIFVVCSVFVALEFGVQAYDQKPLSLAADEKPAQIEGVGIDENLGAKVDLSLSFKNEVGEPVTLSSFYRNKPVVISLIYFGCPGLCNFHFNGVIDAFKGLDWNPGNQFEVVAISFDPREGADLAQKKKANYMKLFGRPGTESGFHFLTADESTIKTITNQIGFRYKWDEGAKEWAHASAAVVTSPNGVISRYLHGIQFDSKTFRMALGEAGEGKIGTLVDKVIWYCFHYDPKTSQYTIYAYRLVQLGGIAIIILLGFLLIPFWLRARRAAGSAS